MLWSDAGTGAEKIIDILYDAKGRKLRKTVTDNTTLLYRQDYAGSLEYRFTTANGLQPEAVYFGDGRVAFIENTRRYEYYLKDHLGNIRLTFTDKNNNGVVDVNNTANNEILQENHYYPFGMDQSGPWMNDAALDNAYKYNGKELNSDFGLQWMDYGARWYDGALGRWFSVDPMASMGPEYSPYNYSFNNAIKYTDPDGQWPIETIWDAANVVYDAGRVVYHTATGNKAAQKEALTDLAADGLALIVPYVPAGVTKVKYVDDVVGIANGSEKAVDKAKDTQKTFQTYTKTNEKTGEVYSGKTSGTKSPQKNVEARDKKHHVNKDGFGPAKLDQSSPNKDAIRGREQELIEINGGAKSQGGTSGNKINSVSPNNPNAEKYRTEAKKEFGN